MSSLWTPDGDQPVEPTQDRRSEARTPQGFQEEPIDENERVQMEAQMDLLRKQLAETPASLVVANHCFGLFELAALHMAQQPPSLSEAQLAIDALGALVESLTGRLGENEPQLKQGLDQLRLAFVQIRKGTAEGETAAN